MKFLKLRFGERPHVVSEQWPLLYRGPDEVHRKCIGTDIICREFACRQCSATVIAAVVAIFLICYAVEIYSSFCYFTAVCAMHKNLYNVVRFLVIVNSAANPIAYSLLKRDIRRELARIFCNYSFNKRRLKRSFAERTTTV